MSELVVIQLFFWAPLSTQAPSQTNTLWGFEFISRLFGRGCLEDSSFATCTSTVVRLMRTRSPKFRFLWHLYLNPFFGEQYPEFEFILDWELGGVLCRLLKMRCIQKVWKMPSLWLVDVSFAFYTGMKLFGNMGSFFRSLFFRYYFVFSRKRSKLSVFEIFFNCKKRIEIRIMLLENAIFSLLADFRKNLFDAVWVSLDCFPNAVYGVSFHFAVSDKTFLLPQLLQQRTLP